MDRRRNRRTRPQYGRVKSRMFDFPYLYTPRSEKGAKGPITLLAASVRPSPGGRGLRRQTWHTADSVFLQAPVSCFPIPKLALDDAKDVLNLAADREFLLLNPECAVYGVVTYFGKPAGTEIDAVLNGGQILVIYNFHTLLKPQIG